MQVGLGVDIRLAVAADDDALASLARDEIEHGLGWTWTPARIAAARAAADMTLAVAWRGPQRLGFGLMRYFDDTAHLCLLAVAPGVRRQGVATGLLAWLEASARTAGIAEVGLEMRVSNDAARTFYERQGYAVVGRTAG